jgi:hypothetical protein
MSLKRRAKAKVALNGPLLDGLPQLRVVEYRPIGYPPLARQTHTSGPVTFRVLVGSDGLVSKVDLVSGSPLFFDGAKQAILRWKFLPLESREVEFQLACIFAFNGITDGDLGRTFVQAPQ